MRRHLALVILSGMVPSLAFAAERPVSRNSETHIQQLDPKLKVRPEAPTAPEANATDSAPMTGRATHCTPENATTPECATAATHGGATR